MSLESLEKKESFIELALKEMSKKKKPQTVEKICKKVFEDCGINPNAEEISQFQIDFMLSGYFVYVGEDENGQKLWDLKNRQKTTLLDKEDQHVIKTDDDIEAEQKELKDDSIYETSVSQEETTSESEEEENDESQEEERDEFEEEFNNESDEEGDDKESYEYEIDEGEDDAEDNYDDEE